MRSSRPNSRRQFKSLDTGTTDAESIVEVTEPSAMTDESLGHGEGNVTPTITVEDSTAGDLQGVVGCFIHVGLPPLADLPRSGNVSGVVFTDEGGALLGHTVFPSGVTEASSWPYVGVGQASPYGAQPDALRGFDIALEVKSIVGRLRRLSTGFNLLVLGLVGLGALLQLGNPIA